MRKIQASRAAIALGVLTAAAGACGGERKEAGGESAAAPPVAEAPAAASGEQLYQRCVTCHMANGEGTPGVFPPLAGSEYATAANVEVPIRVLMHGLSGPVTVKGTEYNGVMPQYGTGIEMTNEEVAAVLTYVRSSWGNSAGPVTPEDVARVRAAERKATGPATAEELDALMK
jgi:mono/diheme cytochrome c family protein